MRWVFASERRWCSSGGVGLGRPFLLGWFVIVSRAAWLFLGDGVLVISACGLLLVVGLSHVGSMRVQVGLVGVVVLVYPVGLLFAGWFQGGRWMGSQSSPNSRGCRWRCNFGGGGGMSGCCLSCISGSGGGIKGLVSGMSASLVAS